VSPGTQAIARSEVAAAPRVPWSEVVQLAFLGLQVGVALLLARAFELEHPAFYRVVLPLAAGGFLVHHWLPRAWQKWFFVALSLAGFGLVFGPGPAAWMVGVGLALVGLCHLPIPFRARLALVLLAAGALLAMRSAWLPTPWPGALWPILGSMFMFRLAVYLYDLRYQGPADVPTVLSYFFLLPNTVFLLFPVIDFQTFRRTYFDKPALAIYGEGVRWIYRGLLHLTLYRLVYQYLVLSPAEVTSTAGIVQYLVANFGLYLRVSGQFHVITGLLHLFGFRLPETHRFFYLAANFTDLWRRINIYWKDFMQKMVYMPVIFSLKRRNQTLVLVVATVSVIVVTWFLHSWQWFWLLGTWLFSATDAAFWGILGVFLVATAILEQRRGRVRQIAAQSRAPRHAWRHALQTAGMFSLMALLWGLWTSPSFGDFRAILATATLRPVDVAVVLGVVGSVAAAAWLTQRFALDAPTALAIKSPWQHPLVASALPLGLFWLAGEPALAGRVPAPLAEVALKARDVDLNRYDAERMQRGYYEEITGVNRFNGELWEVYARADQAEEPDFKDAGLGGFQNDGHGNRCFKPFVRSIYKGGTFSTNRWGFRDRDYEKVPDDATLRVVVLGPSYVLGSGVNDGEPFEQLVEDRLNADWSASSGVHYELLNLAMPSSSLVEISDIVASGRAQEFEPDVLLVVVHMNWHKVIATDFWHRMQGGRPLPESLLKRLPDVALDTATSEAEVARALLPHIDVLARWAFASVADAARGMGALPVLALIPMPSDPFEFHEKPMLLKVARDAGFVVIDMQDVFRGRTKEDLILNNADYHPNAAGHRIIAARLYDELMGHPEVLAAQR
jgi:D-alanyl-lipoteichoic acid acyltransferase DltB (MBOAT superfamily)